MKGGERLKGMLLGAGKGMMRVWMTSEVLPAHESIKRNWSSLELSNS